MLQSVVEAKPYILLFFWLLWLLVIITIKVADKISKIEYVLQQFWSWAQLVLRIEWNKEKVQPEKNGVIKLMPIYTSILLIFAPLDAW